LTSLVRTAMKSEVKFFGAIVNGMPAALIKSHESLLLHMFDVKIVGMKIFSFRKKDIHRTTQEKKPRYTNVPVEKTTK